MDLMSTLTEFFGGDEEKARKALLTPQQPVPSPQPPLQPQMPALAPPSASIGQPQQQQGLPAAPNAAQAGPGQQDYAAAALQSIQPQKPKEQSWGDIGKGLIAPLAIGVLSSLYGKAQGHRGSAYGGALSGFQAWNALRQQEMQRQALQQRQGMSVAHLLAQLSNAAGSHEIAQSNLALRQQSVEQTKEWHQTLADAEKERQQTRVESQQTREEGLGVRKEDAELRRRSEERKEQNWQIVQSGREATVKALRDANMPVVADLVAGGAPISAGIASLKATGRSVPGAAEPYELLDPKTGERQLSTKARVAEMIANGENPRKWNKTDGDNIQLMKGLRTQLAGVLDANEKVTDPKFPFSLDRKALYAAYASGGVLPTGQMVAPELGGYFSRVKNTTVALAGLGKAVSGQRAIALFNAVQGHFPDVGDTHEQAKTKAKVIEYAMDATFDSMGLPDLVQHKRELQRVKEKYGLTPEDPNYVQQLTEGMKTVYQYNPTLKIFTKTGEREETPPPAAKEAAPTPSALKSYIAPGTKPPQPGEKAVFDTPSTKADLIKYYKQQGMTDAQARKKAGEQEMTQPKGPPKSFWDLPDGGRID